ncbi:hypothetical protein ACPCYY_21260, partial [Bacillus pumilus]|uniref:hypothetical protein n=1 Tax=Bacillus pumilus TaxID=1408 RepID=UPI003C135BEB
DLVALLQCSKCIAEFRRCMEPNSFFIKEALTEQHDWVDDIRCRLRPEEIDATICLLDSGLSSAHPLIAPFIDKDNIYTV